MNHEAPTLKLEAQTYELPLTGERNPARASNKNPMVRKHGLGPEQQTCVGCWSLIRMKPNASTFFKCQRRGITSGPATDHRVGYDACAFFSPKHRELRCPFCKANTPHVLTYNTTVRCEQCHRYHEPEPTTGAST